MHSQTAQPGMLWPPTWLTCLQLPHSLACLLHSLCQLCDAFLLGIHILHGGCRCQTACVLDQGCSRVFTVHCATLQLAHSSWTAGSLLLHGTDLPPHGGTAAARRLQHLGGQRDGQSTRAAQGMVSPESITAASRQQLHHAGNVADLTSLLREGPASCKDM